MSAITQTRTRYRTLATYTLLLLIVGSGLILRTWNINFDRGTGSHPDERSTSCFFAPSIALPASWDEFTDPQRSPLNPLWDPVQQQPRSFTYGHFPLYLGVLMGHGLETLAPLAERVGLPETPVSYMRRATQPCSGIAIAGRLTIALLDTLTIVLLFLLGLRVGGAAVGLLAAAFYAFAAQAVQLSHFFAMDPASTTFTVLAVLGSVMMVQERSLRAAAVAGLGVGLAIASKFSALPVLLCPVVAGVLVVVDEAQRGDDAGDDAARPRNARHQLIAIVGVVLALGIAALSFFVTSPYAVLDWRNFLQATLVEQGRMVRGVADWPFTRQYRNTLPYIYFIQQQVRWGLGLPLGLLALTGTLYAFGALLHGLWRLLHTLLANLRGTTGTLLSEWQMHNIVIWSWVLPYFGITGAFLAKFNRYMLPVLPFALLFGAVLIGKLWAWSRGRTEERRLETGDWRPKTGERELEAGERGLESGDQEPEIEDWRPITSHESPVSSLQSPITNRWARYGLRTLAVLLAVIGVAGGIFWSAAYVNGVYNTEHPWVIASRWMAENIPPGSVLLCEEWDDCLPPGSLDEPAIHAARAGFRHIDWGPYEDEDAEKYAELQDKLREADYVIYASKRIYDSVDELPARYPMTNLYYQYMWDGSLGFELALDVTTPPKLFGYTFEDRGADESWSLYDHPQVTIFRKVRDLSNAEFDALLGGTWENARRGYVGEGTPLDPLLNVAGLGRSPASAERGLLNTVIGLLMGEEHSQGNSAAAPEERPDLLLERPLDALPVVDNYRWNAFASEREPVAIAWWWFVVSLLGWITWPISFAVFNPLRDRGYLLSRAFGWLLAGWLLWLVVSAGWAINSVVNAWLVVALLGLIGIGAALHQGRSMRTFLRANWPLLLVGEALFAAAYLAFVGIRMANPDLWQPWFGGEKFMEFAFLNGILRSPTFPPVDPHFAGGFINYYYFGIYLVAYLIKLTGIYAEVAFNLAIPTLFALTVVNTYAVAYSAIRPLRGSGAIDSSPPDAPDEEIPAVVRPREPEQTGKRTRLQRDSHVTVTILDDEGTTAELEPVPDPEADTPLPWQRGLLTALLAPLFVVILGNLDGFAQIVRTLAQYSDATFRSALPGLQTAVRAVDGWNDVLRSEQALPGYDFWGPSRVIPNTINEFPYWSFLFADLHPHLIGIPFAALFLGLVLVLLRVQTDWWRRARGRGLLLLATFGLLLGTLASVNLWELPTYLGLGILALLISQFHSQGRIRWLWTVLTALAYVTLAYVSFLPFFRSYTSPAIGGVGLVREPDDVGTWLLIWGFLGFVLISWVVYAASRKPHSRRDAAGRLIRPTGTERWLSLALRRFGRLPRLLYLHRLLVRRPTLSYLIGVSLVPVLMVAALIAALIGYGVLALCLFPLGAAFLLLWRRGDGADPGSLFTALMVVTGLAILAGTQVIFLKDFLQGGDWYRMNTLFKFFSQVWVLWGTAAAIALPRFWSDVITRSAGRRSAADAATLDEVDIPADAAPARATPVSTSMARSHPALRAVWVFVFVVLLAPSFAFLVWGTPARLEQRLIGWQPEFGTLNGLAYMRNGTYTWPNGDNTFELQYDWEAIQWLLDNVRGNAVVVESAEVDYYRAGGTRIASLTGLSGLRGMHASEQRFGEQLGPRDARHREFWNTPDPARTRELINELNISLIYVGQLERYLHPEGARKLEEMAATGQLTPMYENERVTIYGVPSQLAQRSDE